MSRIVLCVFSPLNFVMSCLLLEGLSGSHFTAALVLAAMVACVRDKRD